ncbi:cytochrome P450 [Earliella scabrosa]|nr:cytochrome P450 [Earliella scabrosa]
MSQLSWPVLRRLRIQGHHALLLFILSDLLLYVSLRAELMRRPATYSPLVVAMVTTALFGLSLTFLTIGYRFSSWNPLYEYPGPWVCKISSLWLTGISFTGRRHFVLHKLHARYGDIVRIGPNILSVNMPSITSMYQFMEKSEAYRRPDRTNIVTLFFKNTTEKLHRDRKRIWSTLFTPAGQAELLVPLERRVWELMQCLEGRQAQGSDGYVDFGLAIAHWSYDFMGDMVFGGCNEFNLMKNGDPWEYINTGKKAMILLDAAGQTPWLMEILWHIPTSRNMRRLISNSQRMIRARIATPKIPGHRDLASYWIDANLSQVDMERDTLVAMQSGSDNTSVKTTLALFFLLAEPSYYRKLQEKLDKTCLNPTGPLPMNDLTTLPLLNGVINETLRLGTPYFLPRVVPKGGIALDGRYIPEETIVAHASYSQQISADNFFPDPLEFRPERWMSDGLGPDTKTNKGALASFSFGPHACIAKNLAYQEMRYVLARLLLCYNMTLPEGFDVAGYRNGILNMRTTVLTHKLLVKVERRPGIDLDNPMV